MNFKSIILSGVALAAFVGAAFAAPLQQHASNAAPAAQGFATSTAATPSTTTAPTKTTVAPADTASIPLNAVTEPTTTLKSVSVQAEDGIKVGTISKVHTDASGQASSIDVKVGSKTVSLLASQANFDATQKIVVAQLSADEIKALPKPTVTPAKPSETAPAKTPDTTAPATPPSGQ